MQSSNPLIAVSISAALAIGSATAATAQTEPSNTAAARAKESRITEIGSPRSEKQEHNLVTQLPRDLLHELRESQGEDEDSDRLARDERENERDSELAQESLDASEQEPDDPETTEPELDSSNSDSSAAEPVQESPTADSSASDAIEPAEGEATTSEDATSEPDEAEAEAEVDGTDASEPEATTPESIEPNETEANEPSQESADEEPVSEESAAEDENVSAEPNEDDVLPADVEGETTPPEPVVQNQAQDADEAENSDSEDSETENLETENLETENQNTAEPNEAEADRGETEAVQEDGSVEDAEDDAEDEDSGSPVNSIDDDSADEDPNITTPIPNTSAPAPDYLDPDPNPLSFPTQPEEVEIVGTQPITLAQAIELAIRNNAEVQQNRLELQRAQAALREAEAANYPTVDVDANLGFSGQESPDSQQSFNPITGGFESEVDGTDLQTSLVLGGEVSVNYNIYTSGRRSAIIEASERQVRFQELEVESIVEDLILQITNDYYALQEADEQVQIFQAAVDEAERSLRDAEALERAGVGTRFDVLQAQVDLANAVQDLTNQQSQQEIARRQLAERLNLSQSVTLAAAEPVEVAGVWELDLEETIVQAFQNRAELQQALVRREIAERNRRAALAQLGPQVGVGASYGLNNTLASDPESAAEEVGFLSNFQVQLGVSLRLFDGGQARAQARQAEADIGIAETEFANTRDQVRFEVEQSFSQLQSNFENIQTTALAVQQAAEALRLARLRFQAGVGTQTDVLRSQTALTQARFNNLRAILDYNRALASLQRSVSNLPEGFLNEVP